MLNMRLNWVQKLVATLTEIQAAGSTVTVPIRHTSIDRPRATFKSTVRALNAAVRKEPSKWTRIGEDGQQRRRWRHPRVYQVQSRGDGFSESKHCDQVELSKAETSDATALRRQQGATRWQWNSARTPKRSKVYPPGTAIIFFCPSSLTPFSVRLIFDYLSYHVLESLYKLLKI